MAKWVTWLAVGLGALAIGLAIVLGDNGWMVHPADDPLNNAIRVATPLFVVAVFLERALSVLNDLLFGQAAVEARSRLRVALLTADAGPAAATAQLDLDTIDDQKQRVRLGVGFVVATLISGAGVRTLAGLVTIVPAVAAGSKVGNQQALLDTMDVILTAGLLAGGPATGTHRPSQYAADQHGRGRDAAPCPRRTALPAPSRLRPRKLERHDRAGAT
jgi:hypothetical protein